MIAMWTDNMIGFDLETSGTNVETARVVTATIVAVDSTGARQVTNWLADPGIDIPAEATAVHGITTEHAREHGRPADEVVYEVEQALQDAWTVGTPVVIFNAPYDLTLLDRELRRYGEPGIDGIGPVVDPLVIDKAVDRYRKGSRKLASVCAHYGITLAADEAHTSAGDALAAVRLAWKLAQLFPGELGDLVDLQTRQAKWYREQADSFESYLRRRKVVDGASREELDAISVPRDWPIRPYP